MMVMSLPGGEKLREEKVKVIKTCDAATAMLSAIIGECQAARLRPRLNAVSKAKNEVATGTQDRWAKAKAANAEVKVPATALIAQGSPPVKASTEIQRRHKRARIDDEPQHDWDFPPAKGNIEHDIPCIGCTHQGERCMGIPSRPCSRCQAGNLLCTKTSRRGRKMGEGKETAVERAAGAEGPEGNASAQSSHVAQAGPAREKSSLDLLTPSTSSKNIMLKRKEMGKVVAAEAHARPISKVKVAERLTELQERIQETRAELRRLEDEQLEVMTELVQSHSSCAAFDES